MSNQGGMFSGRTSLTGPYQLRAVLATTMLAGGALVAGCSSAPATAAPGPATTAPGARDDRARAQVRG